MRALDVIAVIALHAFDFLRVQRAHGFRRRTNDQAAVGKFLALGDKRIEKLPYSIRVLLESAVRNCDDFAVKENDVEKILDWVKTSKQDVEIPFRPARVILQDFT